MSDVTQGQDQPQPVQGGIFGGMSSQPLGWGDPTGSRPAQPGGAGASALAPQSPLAAVGPPPAPTAGPPPGGSINYPPIPQVPKTQQFKEPPPDAKEYQRDAMQWASAFAVLGALAGRFTRAPGGAALAAFGEAVKGWQTGNLGAYQQASDKWEKQSKLAIENNRQVLEDYRLTIENYKLNIDQQMSELNLKSAKWHDQQMYDSTRAGNWTTSMQIYEKGVEWTQKAQDRTNTLAEKRQKEQESAPYWLSPAGQTELNAVNPDGTPKYSLTQKAGIKQLVDYYKAKGVRGGYIGQLVANENADREARGEAPMTADEEIKWQADRAGTIAAARVTASAEPRADAATLTGLVKQKSSIESFERTAIANGEKLKQLADKVDRTGKPAIEGWLRAGRQATGDVAVAEFNTQMNVYRAEVAKIITNPNLSGVLSDSARREVDGFMSGGASAKQIRAVVDLLTQDFGRRMQSIDDEIATVRSHLKGGSATPAPSATPAAATTPATSGAPATDPTNMSDDDLKKKLGL